MRSQSASGPMMLAEQHNLRPGVTLAVVLAAFSVLCAEARGAWVSDSRNMMGTEVRVRLWHEDAVRGRQTVEDAFAEIARIEALMSTYRDDSRISEINRDAHQRAVPAGNELYSLIIRALDVSVLTRGAFDITYDSVGQHYDFRRGKHPDAATLDAALPRIDYRLVETRASDASVHFAAAGVRINLGGIAKGYAVERGVEVLRRQGVRHGIVTAGGDSRLLGDRRGQPWIIGVREPRADDEVAVRIPLIDEAVSTSGDYERFFIEGGRRYHHILTPATGEPAGGVHSATVVGPDAVLTDALSTSVFVMGVDEGLRLIATLPDYEAVVIDADGQLYYSDGLRPPDKPARPPR